jgi:hypothetical protein
MSPVTRLSKLAKVIRSTLSFTKMSASTMTKSFISLIKQKHWDVKKKTLTITEHEESNVELQLTRIANQKKEVIEENFKSISKTISKRLGLKTNPLRPSMVDTILHSFINPLYLAQHDFHSQKEHVFRRQNELFSSLGSGHDKDLLKRCQFIADNVEEKGLNRVVTMDGHGRLLGKLMEHCPKSTTFKVVEIDREVHDWHQSVFPEDIAEHGNVFTTIWKLAESREIETTFVYLNFCGVTDQMHLVQATVNHLLWYDGRYKTNCMSHLMISFSVGRVAQRSTKPLISFLDLWSYTELTGRSDFLTFAYDV